MKINTVHITNMHNYTSIRKQKHTTLAQTSFFSDQRLLMAFYTYAMFIFFAISFKMAFCWTKELKKTVTSVFHSFTFYAQCFSQ